MWDFESLKTILFKEVLNKITATDIWNVNSNAQGKVWGWTSGLEEGSAVMTELVPVKSLTKQQKPVMGFLQTVECTMCESTVSLTKQDNHHWHSANKRAIISLKKGEIKTDHILYCDTKVNDGPVTSTKLVYL